MKIVRQLLLVAVAWWLRQGGAPTVAGHCARSCGRVPIPYPFGLEPQCASPEHTKEFLLHCNKTEGSGSQLLLGNYTIRKISVSDSTMVIRLPELNDCYNKSGSPLNTSYRSQNLDIDLSEYPQYIFSATRNALTVLGCDTYALTNVTAASDILDFSRGGCISYCSEYVDLAKETTCSGIGCCQASIPKGLKTLHFGIGSFNYHRNVSSFSPCGVAFVGDKELFNISRRRLPNFDDLGKTSDLVLDWMIGWNVNCTQAMLDQSSYACGNNTECRDFVDGPDGPGYRCFCKAGCEGNPYNRSRGCEECKNPGADRPFKAIVGILATGVGTYASALASVAWKLRIRKINFRKNGGKLLKHPRVRIFTEVELAKATNNYDESKKLGEGGFGSVYKGRIAVDEGGFGSANKGRIIEVAIKKPKDVHKPLMKKGFQDQLKTVILKNHENVVKLYGICLETRIPLLVYEYILNDTLFKHIHPKVSAILRSWKNRLRIATEAALALKEMHSSKIIHGNIKSANILLDHNYLVKISDFGTSQLMSPEHSHIVAAEKESTLGYIDPEYLTTGKLTIESDVYSFGVVLMELLTEKKPISSDTNEFGEPINIISHFISSVKNKTLSDVVNFEAASEDEIKQVETIAKIAAKCLDQSRRKRPTMSEVAQQLAPINQSLTVAGNIEVDVTIDTSAEILVTAEASEHAMSSCLSWLDLASSCI